MDAGSIFFLVVVGAVLAIAVLRKPVKTYIDKRGLLADRVKDAKAKAEREALR